MGSMLPYIAAPWILWVRICESRRLWTSAFCIPAFWKRVAGWWWKKKASEKCQLGLLFPIYGKIKNAPNHQPGSTLYAQIENHDLTLHIWDWQSFVINWKVVKVAFSMAIFVWPIGGNPGIIHPVSSCIMNPPNPNNHRSPVRGQNCHPAQHLKPILVQITYIYSRYSNWPKSAWEVLYRFCYSPGVSDHQDAWTNIPKKSLANRDVRPISSPCMMHLSIIRYIKLIHTVSHTYIVSFQRIVQHAYAKQFSALANCWATLAAGLAMSCPSAKGRIEPWDVPKSISTFRMKHREGLLREGGTWNTFKSRSGHWIQVELVLMKYKGSDKN